MPPEPDRCPSCHQPNHCAVAAGGDRGGTVWCWCMAQSPAAAALPGSGTPGAQPACLCQACLQRWVRSTHAPGY